MARCSNSFAIAIAPMQQKQSTRSESLINDDLVANVIGQLEALDPRLFVERPIIEMQDDGHFVLVLIQAPEGIGHDEVRAFLFKAQCVAQAGFPVRDGAYSWMINVRVANQLVESVFGGDSRSPDSGLIERR